MRYFVPQFKLAVLCEPQHKLTSKIGGLPWGMPPERWPQCCGKPQQLLAQILHDPPMVDLGGDAVLHLFMCNECYGINEHGRAAFLINRADMAEGLVLPHATNTRAMNAEAFIVGWQERDDGIPPERLAEFYDDRHQSKLMKEFPNVDWFGCRAHTKAGGSPLWTGHGAMGFPPPPFEFLMQFDSYLFIDGPVPSPDAVDSTVTHYVAGSSERREEIPSQVRDLPNAPWAVMHEEGKNEWYFWWANLALDGTAYVFIDRTRRPHAVKWFLNR